MTQRWLRKHQNTVLVPLTLVIIVTFVFVFGAGSRVFRRSGGTVAIIEGRRITFGEFFAVEKALVRLTGREIDRDDVVLIHFAKALAAEKAGMRPSSVELRQAKRGVFSSWLRKRDYTAEELQKELHRRGVPLPELSRVMEEDLAWSKLDELIGSSAKLTTDELYLTRAREEQRLTVLYKDLRVSQYEEDVEVSEEEVSVYYESNKRRPRSAVPELYTEPEADIALLFAPEEAYLGDVKIEEAEIEEYYEQRKQFLYKKEGEDGFRPLEEVRAEIEEELTRRRALILARDELRKAVEAFNEAYDSGGSPGVADHAGKGLRAMSRLGVKSSEMEQFGEAGDCRELAPIIFAERSREELGGALSSPASVEKGWAAIKIRNFRPSELRSLDEAKEEIASKLKAKESKNKAREAAIEFIVRWRKNEVDESEDVERRGPVGSDDEVAAGFAYLAVGEVSDAVPFGEGESEGEGEGEGEEGMLYRVAKLISREMPSREELRPDEKLRKRSLRMRYAFLGRWFRNYLDNLEWDKREAVHRPRPSAD